QHTQLDLSHIEPAAMFGCEMEFQSIQNAASLRRLKGFIQGSRDMSIQIVLHHDTSLGIREVLMNHLIDTVSPIHLRTSFGDFEMTPIQERCKEHKEIGRPLPAIFIIIALWMSFLEGKTLARLAD